MISYNTNKHRRSLLKCLCIITILCLCCPFQTIAQQSSQQNQISIGIKDNVYSKILKEDREIWVHVPKSLNDGLVYQKKRYPVIYLLDGDTNFYSVTGMVRQLSSVNGNEICPEMIVVGIVNTNRLRDLTPSKMENRQDSGGGEAFISFIEKELFPYIDNKYPTQPHRTLIGHSLGGLTVLNTLINHQNLFTNYVAIDPSLLWNDQKLLKQATKKLKTEKYTGKHLYMSIANNSERILKLKTIIKDKTASTSFIRTLLKFKNNVVSNSQNDLNFSWKFYKDDNHGSVPLISEYDALHFLYSWYEIKGIRKLLDPAKATSAKDFINHINKHYQKVSNHLGYQVLPKESLVNQLGYIFMGNNQNEKAQVLFEFNIKNYPKSANVYDSMGDYYEAQSNTTKAIEYFKKAYEIGKSSQTKEKLDKLIANKK